MCSLLLSLQKITFEICQNMLYMLIAECAQQIPMHGERMAKILEF
jgi:hypothetical protein